MNDLTDAKKSYDCSDLSTEEMNKILPAYDIAATDALWANAAMSEGCDDDISDIQFKDEEVEESLVHMQDETTFNPLVTAETLKVGDLVYDKKSGHKLKVAAIEAKGTWSKVITWKDIDTNSISQTQTGNNALFELVVDGDTAYEVGDDIELEVHPIDTYFESIKEDMENVTNEEIRLDVVNNVVDALHSMGYDDDFIGSYVHVEVKDIEDDRVEVEVRGEFNYDELFELTNRLNKVISKYDKHAYFDVEDAGIASAYLLKDQSGYIVNEELVNAFKDIIDKCATKEELKKVYIERIIPLSENNTLNQGTYDAVLDLVDKKLDLLEGKSVKEELEETNEDGWGEEVAKVLEDVFDKMDRISYEVKNTVRGSYVGGKTVGDLVDELNDVKDMLDDAIDELEDNAERINESTLNEGPGAGYTIKSSGYDVKGEIVNVKYSEEEDEHYTNCKLDCKVNLTGKVQKFNAEGVYGGTGDVQYLPIKCDHVYIEATKGDLEDWKVINSNNEINKTALLDLIIDGLRDTYCSFTYGGGGWSHATYDGQLTDDNWLDGIYYCDIKASIYLSNEEDIKKVDRMTRGYGYETMYDVIDEDGNAIESFKDENEAIEYAIINKCLRVDMVSVTTYWDGSEDVRYNDTIWDWETHLKKMGFKKMNEKLNTNPLKDLRESDEETPYTKEEVEIELKSFTRNFTIKEGDLKTGFKEEKNFCVEILKQHYKVVEVSGDDRREGTWYHISFATPKLNEKLNTSTKTFSQWFDETQPKDNNEFYPFSEYIKTFESAEVLKDATAMDIVKNAHKFYDVYPVDSSDREKAFLFARDELGIKYDDLYDAWLNDQPIKYVKESFGNSTKSIKESISSDDRRKALANHLGVSVEDVVQTYDENNFEVQSTGEEYIVADYDTAYDLAEQDIRDTFDDLGIGAFTPYFQEWVMDYAVDEDWFKDALAESQRYYYEDMDEDEFIEVCKENDISPDDENAIDELVDMYLDDIDDYVAEFKSIFGDSEFSTAVKENDLIDLGKVVEEAISVDGIAHFLASYDGEEIELSDNLFAYRTN